MKYINTNKINELKITKENVFIVLDFDRTITSFESADSWDACGGLLGKEFQKDIDDYYEYYRPIEEDYSMDIRKKEKHMEDWYNKCINLYPKYNLTKSKLEESVTKGQMEFRDGVEEFLKNANKYDIPVIILSAGIGNVIEIFLKNHNLYFDNMYIIGNFLEFDENGVIKQFDSDMIHTLNKTMKNHLPKEFENRIKQKEYGILVGDLISDKKMVDENMLDKVITVGFLKDENNLDVYNKNFDIVLDKEDANFNNIEKIILRKERKD